MNTIRLTPQQLAEQLPELRTAIISTYDDYITLQGSITTPQTFEIGSKEERYPILTVEPSFINIFSGRELEVMSYFWKHEGQVSDCEYFIYEKNHAYTYKNKKTGYKSVTKGGNIINVLMYGVKQKLQLHAINWQFEKKGHAPFLIFFKFVKKNI